MLPQRTRILARPMGLPCSLPVWSTVFDYCQPPVNLGSEEWMSPRPLAGLLIGFSRLRGPSSYPGWMLIYSGELAPLADVMHFTTSEIQLSAERATCIFRVSFNVSHSRKCLPLSSNILKCCGAIGVMLCKWRSPL